MVKCPICGKERERLNRHHWIYPSSGVSVIAKMCFPCHRTGNALRELHNFVQREGIIPLARLFNSMPNEMAVRLLRALRELY